MITDSPRIRAMPPDLVAQIKAGEVIERPASVVKELVENAIDAGAQRIRVELEAGGTSLIRVIDDGCGIPCDSLELAFGEHTSSKLHSAEDMERITTLGFRGEALFAISNVARVEAVSGPKGAATAQSVIFDHGALVASEPAASGGGTRFAVYDLFGQVPARRKHLRSPRAETAAIHQVVAQYGIAHPGTAVSLYSDGRAIFSSPGSGRLEDAFGSVYGPDVAGKMLPLSAEGPIAVSGLVSPPSLSRPNRTAIHIFVNGRPVRSAALMFAVEDSLSGLLMIGRHPLAAIIVTVPPEHIDPNVHPTKQEVRFLADRPVFAAVRRAVAEAVVASPQAAEAAMAFTPTEPSIPLAFTIPEPERRPYPPDIAFPSPSQGEKTPPPPAPTLPRLRVFGQAAHTFIVAEGPTGLYMIDQHAAHERVLFDILCARPKSVDRQPLLAPEPIELTADEMAVVEGHHEELATCGFDIQPFGGSTWRVHAVPIVNGHAVRADSIRDVLDAIGQAGSPDDVLNQVFTVVACKAAVKSGDSLTMAEMRQLVESLETTANPRTCPHGRPTTIHISTDRLEREFGRR